jgi:hypothetical protein
MQYNFKYVLSLLGGVVVSLLDNLGVRSVNNSFSMNNSINSKLNIISKVAGFINNSNKSPRDLALGMMSSMDRNTSIQLKNFLHSAGISDSDLIKYDIKI